MPSQTEFLDNNFTDSAKVVGFTYSEPKKAGKSPPVYASEWAAIKTGVGKLVPGAIMKGQSPSLKEMLDALVLEGATWQELATALPEADGTAKTTLTDKLKAQADAIGKSVDSLLPVIAKQVALNDQQSKSGPFNTDATIQPGSAATYNTPLGALRDDIHALNQKIGIAILGLD